MKKLILKYSRLFAIAWTAIIFILCCTPGRYIPTTNWLELLSFDKFVHATMFCIMICLWLIHRYHSGNMSVSFLLLTLVLCITYGGLLEVMQATVFSQRSGDWLDFIANSLGCLIGVWIFQKMKVRLVSYE